MRNQVEKNAPVIIVGTRKIRSWTYMVLPHYEKINTQLTKELGLETFNQFNK
ncbi:hypothetical protein D1872_248990 [compost metagenome]